MHYLAWRYCKLVNFYFWHTVTICPSIRASLRFVAPARMSSHQWGMIRSNHRIIDQEISKAVSSSPAGSTAQLAAGAWSRSHCMCVFTNTKTISSNQSIKHVVLAIFGPWPSRPLFRFLLSWGCDRAGVSFSKQNFLKISFSFIVLHATTRLR